MSGVEPIVAALVSKLATEENLELLIGLVGGVINELVRKGALTPEQAAERKAFMVARMGSDHWQSKG